MFRLLVALSLLPVVALAGEITPREGWRVMPTAYTHAELLERLLAIADDAVVVTDSLQRVVVYNEGAERVFGHRIADVLYEKADYRMPIDLQVGDKLEIRSAGAYTTTYASVAFNGFDPIKTYCV